MQKKKKIIWLLTINYLKIGGKIQLYCNWILYLIKHFKNIMKCVFKDRLYKSWGFENSLRRNEMLMYPLWSVFIPISFPGVWLRFYECRDRLWSALGVLSLRELFNEWDFELTN